MFRLWKRFYDDSNLKTKACLVKIGCHFLWEKVFRDFKAVIYRWLSEYLLYFVHMETCSNAHSLNIRNRWTAAAVALHTCSGRGTCRRSHYLMKHQTMASASRPVSCPLHYKCERNSSELLVIMIYFGSWCYYVSSIFFGCTFVSQNIFGRNICCSLLTL